LSAKSQNTALYGKFLLFIAGLGGLLYGIDVGIIAAALLYVDKTISLSVEQTSWIVAAVLGGGTLSSLAAGALADWFGRKPMMILSGFLFVSSVALIVLSQGFLPLFLGRVLQGVSCGAIAVVVPLYLAECLSAKFRGRGTALFQLMLTFGIVVAAVTGFFYTRQAEAAISAAAGNATLVLAAQNHAWRGMFLSVVYPGLLFFLGAFFLSESPRWLLRRGKLDQARAALLRSVSPDEAETELSEMQTLAAERAKRSSSFASLFSRKYIIPFALACLVLSLNQTTGINSVLQYLVIILKQAGMNPAHATQGDVAVKVLNCVMTILGVALVDKKGRKFLLNLGTAGIVLACLLGGLIFYHIESQRRDVADRVRQASVPCHDLVLPVNESTLGPAENDRPMVLSVLYDANEGDRVATVLSNDSDPVLRIPLTRGGASPVVTPSCNITIKRAQYGPVPTESTGWLITACLSLFIASYAAGPGVVVWLVLSELMPTRIRATGMGIALLLNQGISTLIAGVFLPVVGNHGYFAMFFFWSACTLFYFLTSVFLLPETKGKSLEEIEMHFEKSAKPAEA